MGLAFGNYDVRMVLCHNRGDEHDVVRAAKFHLTTAFSDNPLLAAQATSEWLRREVGFGLGKIVATLPSATMDYELIDLSPDQAEPTQIAEIAVQAMDELLGEDLAQATYDYWVDRQAAEPVLHLTWMPRETAVQVGTGLAGSGWTLLALDVPAVSLARSGGFHEPADSVLMVEIIEAEATFVWSSAGEPRYLRNGIHFASHSAAALVAQRRGISPSTAETALANWGLQHDPHTPPLAELHEACLHDWLERLGFEIHRTVRFVQGRHFLAAPPQIVLCGAGAAIPGLPEWMSKHLGMAVAAASLPNNVRWQSAEPYDVGYAAAVANALYEASQ